MSHTGKWDTVDYDKKFKEDFEKAQALSLESLALEKFRLEKQRADRSKSDNVTSQTRTTNVTKKGPGSHKLKEPIIENRISVVSQSTRDELVPKLPPPPSVLRRNSVTTNVSASGSSSTNDLISFHSPTGNKEAQNNQHNSFDYRLFKEPETSSSCVKLSRSSSNASDYQSRSNDGQRKITTPEIGFDLQSLELSGISPLSTMPFQYNRPTTQYGFMSHNTFKSTNSVRSVKSQPNYNCGIATNSFSNYVGFNGSAPGDSSLGVLKVIAKRDNANLIDLTAYDKEPVKDKDKSVRVSLLEAFDPLLSSSPSATYSSDTKGNEETYSEGSIYDPYDPFDYLYSSPSLASQSSDPVYSAVVKAPVTPTSGPPLPPRNSASNQKKVHNESNTRLYENLVVQKRKFSHHDPDLIAFHAIVKKLRGDYSFSDINTNVGLVISATIDNHYNTGTSVKLIIHYAGLENSFIFTCDVSTSVEHIIMNVACELGSAQASDFVLKVIGLEEYLDSQSYLGNYEYVHECIKLEKDIELSLVHTSNLKRPLARTAEDDRRDNMLTLDDLLPKEPTQPISYDALLILLETLEKEMERIEIASREIENGIFSSSFQPRAVMQAVKAVCALLGNVETLQISQALDNFINVVENLPRSQDDFRLKPEIVDDYGDYSVVRLGIESFSEVVIQHCEQIRASVQGLIEMYSHGFRVDFKLNMPRISTGKKLSSEIVDTVIMHIGCLHRLPQKWNHDNYILVAQLYHGTRPIGHAVLSDPVVPSTKLYHRVIFDSWLNFEGTAVSALPRECRLVLVIYGQSIVEEEVKKTELGWAAVQMFNFNGVLIQGNFLLPLWSAETDKRFGPAPSPGTHPFGDSYPVIGIELPDYGGEIHFPAIQRNIQQGYDFSSLDQNTQQQLMEIIEQDIFSNPMVEDREVLWEKRLYLINHPQALPKVLLAALSWDCSCLSDLHSMLYSWSPMDPVGALQLLLPCFPDMEVRGVAVQCIDGLSNDQLVDFLPQMVQALKHETYEASPLAKLLLERSLKSPRVAHHLYWLLIQALPGQTPQNTCEILQSEEINLVEARYHRRFQLMLRSLLATSGEALRNRFMAEQLLVKGLTEVAENVKASKEATRLNVLMQNLHSLNGSLEVTPTCLPLGPSLYITGIHVRSSSYFPSNTLPLKINFTTNEESIIPAIFKVGDDLQQDMLSLQMIRVMDKLWLKEGLDLKMVTFGCVPTGHRKGMIEMVTDSETLRKIQVEFGLTGSFKDRPIAEWLAKHNPSALEYERAVANFTASCAGYSVATYVLGICDRHNDNIMLKTSGHLFHIDFGKFLGDAQMFGNFKRDRTPFVLTSDMAYVINGGDKPSARFHHFVDLCCQAFNIVRRHGNILLNLFGLMVSSGAGGLTADAVRYVQTALLPELSNAEAAATFARMIQSSLKSWFTQFNFFLHNLAQLRFSGDHNDGQLLSFVNKTYTMQQEGRLKSVDVYGYQKRYDPEKYYVYILRVERINHTDPVYLFRSYKEFCEFHQKLCIMFPLVKCHSLQSTGLHMGRSNIKQVAEKRLVDIKKFLSSLFNMADEICHSDLVYTFFHPLLRDQQDSSIHEAKLKDRKKERVINKASYTITGQIKLSLHYQRDTLRIMVYHVRELSCVTGGQEPSTYVKVYLLPDPNKSTKRKTKVVRRSCHPSFMEMLEYRLPLEIVQHRTLQATVWNHDTLQENEFLGGTTIRLDNFDLSKEITEWYPLGHVHR